MLDGSLLADVLRKLACFTAVGGTTPRSHHDQGGFCSGSGISRRDRDRRSAPLPTLAPSMPSCDTPAPFESPRAFLSHSRSSRCPLAAAPHRGAFLAAVAEHAGRG